MKTCSLQTRNLLLLSYIGRWRAEQKEQLDELLPKATGREARIEQRMARR